MMKINCCKAPNLKITKKLALILTAVLAVVLTAGIVLCAVLGFNSSIKDTKNVCVETQYYAYYQSGDEIKGICNEVFAEKGLEAEEEKVAVKNAYSGYDITYVFDKDTDMDTLRDAKDLIDIKLKAAGYQENVNVTTQEVEVIGTMAKNYVGRGMIALAIFAVVSFLYVWIRYKLYAALYTLGGNLLAMGLTTALIALFRIPVTPSVASAIAASVLFSTVTILMFFNKLRAAQQEESAADKSAEELVSSSIAWKETTVFAGLLGVALLVMICVGRAAIAWFSLSAILAILASAFIGLLYVPAMFPAAKRHADKVAAKKASGYKGAKKGEKAKKSNDEEFVD